MAGFGLAAGLILEHLLKIDIWLVVAWAGAPTVVFGFLFVRHAKAIYLAVDHFFDPHVPPAGETKPPGGGGGARVPRR